MTSSSRCCRRRTLSVKCPIDPPWSSYLWRPSSPVRQHAIPCRNDTFAHPAFCYIFSSGLRAAGRSMESTPSSCARLSYTVNMLSTSPVGSPSGTTSSRRVLPIGWLESKRRRRHRSAMVGCFPFFVAQNSMRCRQLALPCECRPCLAARASTSRIAWTACAWRSSLAQRALDLSPILRCCTGVCARTLMSLSSRAGIGVEGKNNHYLKLIATVVDSTVR